MTYLEEKKMIHNIKNWIYRARVLFKRNAIAKNQLYDADDEYIIHGASDYLKGQVQLSQIKEGETIIVISNGKVLQSDPYQFDTIYSIRPQ